MIHQKNSGLVGKTISHYKILEKLGVGGMGIVYKAQDLKLDRFVALKFLPPHISADEEEKQRFIHEAKTVSKLDHPNICAVHEINETEDGQMFIALAFYKGETLKKRIEKGLLKFDEALDITIQVTQGLQEAHNNDIVHRDIKPANIFITNKNEVKILDFGLAKLVGQSKLTKAGSTLGTVGYMSPEQAKGHEVDHRTDIWSLGVVLYEMLTEKLPFGGEYEQAVLYSILNVDPEPLTGLNKSVPSEWEKIVNRCLKKDSKERYPAATDLLADLKPLEKKISSGKAPVRIEKSVARHPIPKRIRKPGVLLGGLILALLLLFVFLFGRKVVKNWLGAETQNLAVLPFTIVGGDSADQAFSDGLAERLTGKLAQLEQFERSLWVVPGSDVRENEITSAVEARRAFSAVTQVVTGSIRRMGDMIVLKMNLIDAKTLRQQNSLEIRDHIANILTWQEGVIIKLVPLLNIELKPEMRRVLIAGGTTVPSAYECYLQGLGYLQNDGKVENLDVAISTFRRAIEQDSLYALAYAELGKAYWLKYNLTKTTNWVEEAQSSCNHAIQMDDDLVPVRVTLGNIYRETGRYEEAIEKYQQALQRDRANFEAHVGLAEAYKEVERLTEAEETYKKAIKLRPSYFAGYNHLGYYYWQYGRLAEAEEMFRKVKALTPDDVTSHNNLIVIYFLMGRVDMSTAAFEKSIAIKPTAEAYSNMGTVHFLNGLYADAMVMYEEATKLGGEDDYILWANLADAYRYTPGNYEKAPAVYQRAIQLTEDQLVINPNNAHLRSSLAVYYAKLGNSINALAEISKAQKLAPDDVTVLHKGIVVLELARQHDQAIQELLKYFERGGSMEEIDNDPDLSGLRMDPRYKQLVENKE